MAAKRRNRRATVPAALYPVQALLRVAGTMAIKKERQHVAAVRTQGQSTE
jgi:hypothetical protein